MQTQREHTHIALNHPSTPPGDCRTSKSRMHWLVITGMSLLLAVTGASAERFGDWEVDRSRDLIVATTTNSSASVFGYACSRSPNECLFFFMPDGLKCNEGGRYALLMNGGRESTSRSTTCRRLSWAEGQQFANVIDGSDGLRNQLMNADESTIGMARGTGADGFSISKFSMRGFRAAYDRVNRRRDSNEGLRDYNSDNRPPAVAPTGTPDVELYEHDDFRGRRLNVRGDISDLETYDFNDTVSSVVVNRGRWELCTDARYRGTCRTYAPGRYNNARPHNDEYSSLRRVN